MSDDSESLRPRNPFLEAVGSVTIAGAQLDSSLHHLLGWIADEPTLLAYANAGSTDQLIQLCRLALAVSLTIWPDDKKAIEACLKRADDLRTRRNDVVHSLYFQVEASQHVKASKPIRKGFGYKSTNISLEEMEAVADEVQKLRDDMYVAGWNAVAVQRGGRRVPTRAEIEAAVAAAVNEAMNKAGDDSASE
ncbi:hypothetical protein ABZ876_37645 [Streptomyces sp. NPDC046931]|uniref:hypothetical protein n=1 Tax=Streptomyces sp. NPDC046931 TaxID=3154806 RepID=UPI0033F55449